jgi:hypothetical protein
LCTVCEPSISRRSIRKPAARSTNAARSAVHAAGEPSSMASNGATVPTIELGHSPVTR